MSQLLYDQIYHLPQGGIFVLEQFRDAEEQCGSFIGREFLASEQEYSDLSEKRPTSSRRNRRRVEEPRFNLLAESGT